MTPTAKEALDAFDIIEREDASVTTTRQFDIVRSFLKQSAAPGKVHAQRVTKDQVFLAFAEIISLRSTCSRNKVGCIITDFDGLQILGIGYNGNAAGLPNQCESSEPGSCQCIHSESNALIKAPGTLPNKILYTSVSPCKACAKLILNSRITRVVYAREYRSTEGIELLRSCGIEVDGRHRDFPF